MNRQDRFDEWLGCQRCRFDIWLCGLRGHRWGRWMYDVPYEEGLGDGCRICERCGTYEYERWQDRGFGKLFRRVSRSRW